MTEMRMLVRLPRTLEKSDSRVHHEGAPVIPRSRLWQEAWHAPRLPWKGTPPDGSRTFAQSHIVHAPSARLARAGSRSHLPFPLERTHELVADRRHRLDGRRPALDAADRPLDPDG